MNRSPEGDTINTVYVSPSGLRENCLPSPVAYATGNACIALRAETNTT